MDRVAHARNIQDKKVAKQLRDRSIYEDLGSSLPQNRHRTCTSHLGPTARIEQSANRRSDKGVQSAVIAYLVQASATIADLLSPKKDAMRNFEHDIWRRLPPALDPDAPSQIYREIAVPPIILSPAGYFVSENTTKAHLRIVLP